MNQRQKIFTILAILVLLGIVSTFIYFVVVNPEYEKPIIDVLVNSIK